MLLYLLLCRCSCAYDLRLYGMYCTDIEAFTTYVIGERDIKVEDIQVNIDDGQQVDKVQFNLCFAVSLLFFANEVQQKFCQSLTFLTHHVLLELHFEILLGHLHHG